MRHALAGLVVGMAITGVLAVGVQFAVWGSTAPEWYAAPVVIVSCLLGCLGAMVGIRSDAAR